jgi:hypothetical protein
MPPYLSPAAPTGSPDTLTIERKINERLKALIWEKQFFGANHTQFQKVSLMYIFGVIGRTHCFDKMYVSHLGF